MFDWLYSHPERVESLNYVMTPLMTPTVFASQVGPCGGRNPFILLCKPSIRKMNPKLCSENDTWSWGLTRML